MSRLRGQQILRLATNLLEVAVNSDLLTLDVDTLGRLLGLEGDMAPVQTRELRVVVEIVLAFDHGGQVEAVTLPFDGHDGFDKARAGGDEGLDEILNGPCLASERFGREVTSCEAAT